MGMDCGGLVSEDGSWVSRRLFYDEEIHEIEKTRVFGRCWLFLGHESQVPNPGDFFLTRMADESVILTRDQTGRINAFLNTCRHRGLKICRQDSGNTGSFVCPYHAWTYGTDGSLRGVPREREAFPDGIDRSRFGLVPVAQVESYKGLVFGNFDRNAPALTDYLGEMAWYLDIHLDRSPGGTEVLGLQKWVIDTNWKMPAENQVGDVIHGPISHASVLDAVGGPDSPQVRSVVDLGRNVALPNGHGCLVAGIEEPERVLAVGDPQTHALLAGYFEDSRAFRLERLGALRERLDIATGTVFPTFSILGRNFTIRVGHPLSATKTEYWSWIMVDRGAPEAVKTAFRRLYQGTFGPFGLLECDDGENWSEVTAGARGSQSSKHDFYYGMGLGCEGPHDELPGNVGHTMSEHPQRGFYKRWRALMMAA